MLRAGSLFVALGLLLVPGCSCRATPPASAPSDVPPKEREISWQEAKSLINSGRIVSASQTHKREVWILDQDGNQYKTQEPAIDDVTKLVDQIDPERKRIRFTTE